MFQRKILLRIYENNNWWIWNNNKMYKLFNVNTDYIRSYLRILTAPNYLNNVHKQWPLSVFIIVIMYLVKHLINSGWCEINKPTVRWKYRQLRISLLFYLTKFEHYYFLDIREMWGKRHQIQYTVFKQAYVSTNSDWFILRKSLSRYFLSVAQSNEDYYDNWYWRFTLKKTVTL